MSEPSSLPLHLEVADRVQENFIAYFRLFAGLPGVLFTEGDMTHIVSKGLPGNLVLSTRLTGDDIEQRIDEALLHIGKHGNEIDWFVFPGCLPDDLGDRLIKRSEAGGPGGAWELFGNIGGPGGTWMLADLADLSNKHPVPDNFHVEWVQNHEQLKEWQQITSAGFGGGDYQILYDAFARHGFGPGAAALNCIGYLDDEPVTSATVWLTGDMASVYNISTPERLRRRGLGSAITLAALQEAQKRGHQTAYLWSSRLGRSVYGKLGFEMVNFGIREYQWRKRAMTA